MCGIVGYTGQKQAQNILLNSLAKLEYRGYDSCGIALAGSPLTVFKDAIRVAELGQSIPDLQGNIGIGHTRWATHGAPCQVNAHPHTDCTGRLAVVHNGIIINYLELRKQLILEGHKFVSETDTEVIPHLIEKYYRGNLEEALNHALKDLVGSYAIIVLAENETGLAFARKDSPLIIGVGDQENLIASDVPALLDYTRNVIYVEDGDVGLITPDSIKISHDGQEIVRKQQQILWSAEQTSKCGYEHFMLKEIHEQPQVIRNTLSGLFSKNELPFDFRRINGNLRNLLFLACGTSYYAALVGKYVCERLTDISVTTELASEFNYYQNIQFAPISVAITQSGETADTLKAMRRLQEAGSKVLAITNVVGSTASKIADHTLYIQAGPEISVAATKSFSGQLTALFWLSLAYSRLDIRAQNEFLTDLRKLPDMTHRALAFEDDIAAAANVISRYDYAIFIGKGINYPIAMEGALKLKEVSYIHSEAYAAGEIKHGPFALLDKDTPVIAIVARDSGYESMLTSIREIKSRGSPVFAIIEESDDAVNYLADYIIPVPKMSVLFSPFVNTVAIQLLAYYVAKARNCPIDFPRNLAKSVTVE